MTKDNKTNKNKNADAKLNPRKPDFSNDGISVWLNKTDKGIEYLSIRLVGHNTIYAYK